MHHTIGRIVVKALIAAQVLDRAIDAVLTDDSGLAYHLAPDADPGRKRPRTAGPALLYHVRPKRVRAQSRVAHPGREACSRGHRANRRTGRAVSGQHMVERKTPLQQCGNSAARGASRLLDSSWRMSQRQECRRPRKSTLIRGRLPNEDELVSNGHYPTASG
jgi:hypothetical protein